MHFKMFLALQHSTYAFIHDLVARAMLEAAVLLLFMTISEGGNTSVLCSGISVVWIFTSVFRGCCEAI